MAASRLVAITSVQGLGAGYRLTQGGDGVSASTSDPAGRETGPFPSQQTRQAWGIRCNDARTPDFWLCLVSFMNWSRIDGWEHRWRLWIVRRWREMEYRRRCAPLRDTQITPRSGLPAKRHTRHTPPAPPSAESTTLDQLVSRRARTGYFEQLPIQRARVGPAQSTQLRIPPMLILPPRNRQSLAGGQSSIIISR